MAEMNCRKCGRNYSDDLLYCLDDGTRLVAGRDVSMDETVADHPRIVIDTGAAADLEYCPACGTGNAPDSRFCKKCGQPLAKVGPVPHVDPIPIYPAVVESQPRRRSYAAIVAVIFALIALLL